MHSECRNQGECALCHHSVALTLFESRLNIIIDVGSVSVWRESWLHLILKRFQVNASYGYVVHIDFHRFQVLTGSRVKSQWFLHRRVMRLATFRKTGTGVSFMYMVLRKVQGSCQSNSVICGGWNDQRKYLEPPQTTHCGFSSGYRKAVEMLSGFWSDAYRS